MNARSFFTTTLCVILVSFFAAGCQLRQAESSPAASTSEAAVVASPSPALVKEYVFTADQDSQTALELSEKNAEFKIKQYEFGAMVESINGQQATKEFYWALYINDEFAKQSADNSKLKKGDVVKWVYEEIKTQ